MGEVGGVGNLSRVSAGAFGGVLVGVGVDVGVGVGIAGGAGVGVGAANSITVHL